MRCRGGVCLQAFFSGDYYRRKFKEVLIPVRAVQLRELSLIEYLDNPALRKGNI